MKSIPVAILLLMLFCVCAYPASAASGSDEAVVVRARAWLSLVDNGRYAESWNEASIYFRGAVSRESWESSLDGIRKPLGRLVRRKTSRTTVARQLPGAPDGNYLVMVFATSFQNKASATETVTFMQEADGGWKAAGYFIR